MPYNYFPTKAFLHISLFLLASVMLGNQAVAACNPAKILRDDVLVVVNDNSISSPIVGDYYCNKRGINPANVAHVRVPATNDVQLDQFISLRDQLIKHMQEKTLSGATPVTCDTSNGYTRFYCPESIEQLLSKSSIRYVVMTKGVPIRFYFNDSTINGVDSNTVPMAGIDNYLRYWLTNYFSEDVAFRPGLVDFLIEKRAVDFGDGRGMRLIDPPNDRELIVGRIDGVDIDSAKRLVDRAITAEQNGIYGKLYGNKFGGTFAGAFGVVGSAHWKQWLVGGSRVAIYPKNPVGLFPAWRYLHGLFGELQGLSDPGNDIAIRHTTNPECVNYDASGRVPKQCVTAINRGDKSVIDNSPLPDDAPGTPGGIIPSPDNALVHQGYFDGFSSLEKFDHLLNWRDSASCNTLCADASDVAACKLASTDVYKEIDTSCVRVAEGYMGNTFGSYPLGMMTSWPTGWFQGVNFNDGKFDLTGGSTYFFWQPEVRKDSGSDDNFSLWYRNTDHAVSANCYIGQDDYKTPPTSKCDLKKKISINQTIEMPERAINLANPQKITIRFKYRGIDLNKDISIYARLLIRESTYDDGVIKIDPGNQVDYDNKFVSKLTAPSTPTDGTSWGEAEVTYTLNPGFHKHPNNLYNGIRISINISNTFEGELAFDDFSLEEDGANIPLVNPSFNDGHRQLSGGDSAVSFLSRLNGTAFWANLSHHEFEGRSFNTHQYETLIYFMRGLPLGDSVWFAELHNSGILYGDPLYSPTAVHLDYLTDSDDRALDDYFNTANSPLKLTGQTLNGSGPNVSTTYNVDYCTGVDFFLCDQSSSWQEVSGIQGLQGGKRDMTLGNWDTSGLDGNYVLRLAVTSTNSTTGLSQTFYDYYTVTMYTPESDIDSDGLSYQKEIDIGTNPWSDDTDEDGLTDGDEVNNIGTNPLAEDSDSDGFTDFVEVERNTDPLNSNSIPAVSTFEVDPANGIDDGQSPFKTISAAIATAKAGDTILLLAGQHNPVFLTFTTPIHLTGPPNQSAILHAISLSSKTKGTIVVSNLSLSNPALSSSVMIISGNRWQFDKNIFSRSIKINSNTSAKFVNNLFVNIDGDAIDLSDGSSTELRNNTLTGNKVGVNAKVGSTVLITNSIISENTTNLLGVFPDDISYSLIGGASFTGTNNNITGDPLFVNSSNGDYHLRPESPAIDAGDPQSDFSKEPTSPTGRINMGAYGNTGEATVGTPKASGGSNGGDKSSDSGGQISGLLLIWFVLYGLLRAHRRS